MPSKIIINGITNIIKVARLDAQEKSKVLQPQVDRVLKDAVISSVSSPSYVFDQSVRTGETVESVAQNV